MFSMQTRFTWHSSRAGNPCPLMCKGTDLGQLRRKFVRVHCQFSQKIPREQLLVERARQLYEDAWSQGKVLLLDTIMAEDHAQVDRVWQQTAGVGRRRMKRGILAYRSAYPDIKFNIGAVAPVPDQDMVFVYWEASGTNLGNIREQPPTGKRVEFAGISLLKFNAAGEIQQSMVFRQAPGDEKAYFLGQAQPIGLGP